MTVPSMMNGRKNGNIPEDVFTPSREVVHNLEPERVVCIVTRKSIGPRSASWLQQLGNAEKSWQKRNFVSIVLAHLIEHQIAEVSALARIAEDDTTHRFVMPTKTYQNLRQD